MNDKKRLEITKQNEALLQKYQLDEKSIQQFRSRIVPCSSILADVKGKQIYEMLNQKYVEMISEKEIEKLILEGANVNYQDKRGNTLLMYACNNLLAALLLRGGASVMIPNFDGKTPLFEASGGGQVARCQLYLLFGADVNHQDVSGNTSLLVTLQECKTSMPLLSDIVKENRKDTIQLLTEANAYLNIQNHEEKNIFDYTCSLEEKEYFLERIRSLFLPNRDDGYKQLDLEIQKELEEIGKPEEYVSSKKVSGKRMEKRKTWKKIN